jgi:hypothetical protein
MPVCPINVSMREALVEEASSAEPSRKVTDEATEVVIVVVAD